MASFACGTRDELRARRPGGRPFIDGRPNKLKFNPRDASRVGRAFRMGGVSENASRNLPLEWDGVSRWGLNRKVRPGIMAQNGMQFPVEASSGNRVPESAPKVGHAFRTGYQPETASHSRHEFRDTFSANKEGHITWPSAYICCGYTHDKPRFNTEASVRAEAYKVHREFRTQRRPLNVASVLRRTVRAGNLICLRPDRRFSYGSAATRYLILVVPGAKLGSVSLASVWKCSVYTFLPSRNIS